MAGQYRFKDSNGNIVAQISASVGGAISFSGSVVDFTQANNIILGNVQLAGTASNALLLDGFDSQAFAFTSSIHPFTASIAGTNAFTSSASTRLDSIETITASNISRLNSLEIKTGSLATTGSNTFIGTQTITGSLFISSDLVVQGSSSLQNITASAVSIGTNIVNLNTANPAIRYAGLSIGDSGSVGGSGSFLYDSVQDEFIFVHRGANTTVTSSVILMGPQTFDNIGSETYPTLNIVQKGTGNEHLGDSCIFDNGTTTCIKNNLVAGVGNFSNCLTFGDWTTATNVLLSNKPNEQGAYIRAAVSTAEYPTYAFEDDRDTGVYRNGANSLGFATSGSARITISCTGIATFACSVLIGKTTNAGGKLQVSNGTVTFNVDHNADGPYLTGATDNNVSYRKLSYDASEHIFLISAAEKMRITSGGVVSINQTCGYGAFNVTGIDCAWGEGIILNPAPNGYSAINFRAEGRTGACYIGTWQLGKISSGETSSGEVFSITRQGTTGGTAYRVDASQQWKTNGDSIFGFKVGIGTCIPSRPLTVYSCTNGGSMSTGCTFLENAYFGNGGLTIGQESGTLNIALMTNSNKDIIFGGWNGTTNAERMRITSGGSVGINTNSPTSNTGLTAKRPTGTGWIIDALNGSNVRMGGIYSTGGNNGQLYLGNSAGTETILLDSAGTSFFNGGNVLVGTNSTCKGLLRVAGDAEVCKTLFFNGGDGNGGAIINTLAAAACATPVYNLRTMFCFNNVGNYGAYLFIHTGYNTVTTKNSTITGIVNNGVNQTISILATTLDSGATAPSVHSTSNWCIAFCWPNPANSNTKFIALAG